MSDRAQVDCEEALRRLAMYQDGELAAAESAEVERHLATCRSCFSRAEFERRLKERIRHDLQVATVPRKSEARIRTLIGMLAREA